jgi:3-deoxy-D-manno-octulosonic-acid transferase
MRFLYNLLFPLAFLLFLPGLLWKLWRRGGEKSNFAERFAKFAAGKRRCLRDGWRGVVWVHAVSVGETVVALQFIRRWQERAPEQRFILSTTTTTGQAMARGRAPSGVEVIFCPLDFILFARPVVNLLRPSLLVIFETEIWPNLIAEVKRRGGRVVLVNARISDRSAKGYRRWRIFFAPILRQFDVICVQSETDRKRFAAVACDLPLHVCGTMKFDQTPPPASAAPDLSPYFGDEPGLTLVAASTHPGEEKLITKTYLALRGEFPGLRLVLVPRHAERGAEIAAELRSLKVAFRQRNWDRGEARTPVVDVLLADTTGELAGLMAAADVVIMGKSLAGHDEGHNLIEPALLGKPTVTGAKVSNFREVMAILQDGGGVMPVKCDGDLSGILRDLLANPARRAELGERAQTAVAAQRGATDRTLDLVVPLCADASAESPK